MADPRIAIAITTDPDHEGGYVNNPDDPGGATKYGITQRDAVAAGLGDVKDLTLERAQDFYFTTHTPERYWNPLYTSIESQGTCNKIFDMGVLFGVGAAVECLQEALGIKVDGDFGSQSLAATNAATKTNETVTLALFKVQLANHVARIIQAKPTDKEFQKGWLARIRSDATAPRPYPVGSSS